MQPRVIPFIFASGYGTRLKPLTSDLPKPLIPVRGEKTIIDFIIDELVKNGFERVLINYSYGKEHYLDLQKRHRGTIDVVLINDQTVCGQGGILIKELALLQSDEYVLCLNGDTIIEFDLAAFISHPSTRMVRLLSDNAQPVQRNLLCTEAGVVAARGTAVDDNNIDWYLPKSAPLTTHNYLGVALIPTTALQNITFNTDYMGFFGKDELVSQLADRGVTATVKSVPIDLFLTANTIEELTTLRAALQ